MPLTVYTLMNDRLHVKAALMKSTMKNLLAMVLHDHFDHIRFHIENQATHVTERTSD